MHKKKVPFSKLIIGFTVTICTLFLVFVCYEMHRLKDLTPLAYIGMAVIGLYSSALGFYVWRARKSDDYELALKKALDEKQLQVPIDINNAIDDMNTQK